MQLEELLTRTWLVIIMGMVMQVGKMLIVRMLVWFQGRWGKIRQHTGIGRGTTSC